MMSETPTCSFCGQAPSESGQLVAERQRRSKLNGRVPLMVLQELRFTIDPHELARKFR